MKKILIHLLLAGLSLGSQAQQVNESYGYFLAGVSAPQGGFRAAFDNNMGGLGLAGNFGFLLNPLAMGRVKQYSPVLLGLDLGWNYLGRSKFLYNGEPYLKTEYWTGNWGLVARLDPPLKGRFRLFGDAFLGWGRYWANTKEDKSLLQSLVDDQQNLVGKYNDNNFTTGLGAGLLVRAKSGSIPSFTLRVMYYFNGEYKAVIRSSIVAAGNTLQYQVRPVNANMFLLQAGISFF